MAGNDLDSSVFDPEPMGSSAPSVDRLLSVDLFLTEEEITEYRNRALEALPERYSEAAEGMSERWANEIAHREALHTAHIFSENVESYLIEHPCVIFDSEAYRLARIAHAALLELYQRIGRLEFDCERAEPASSPTERVELGERSNTEMSFDKSNSSEGSRTTEEET